MKRTLLALASLLFAMPSPLFGWGEVGHRTIGEVAAHLVAIHPDIKRLLSAPDENAREEARQFITILSEKAVQQGHLSNIPDIYWRYLGGGLTQAGNLLGDASHFIDLEPFLLRPQKPFEAVVPLDYEAARRELAIKHPSLSLFKDVGTSPWRAQQFYDLYVWSLAHYPKSGCPSVFDPNSPTRIALTYAGLLSHFVGDISQPYHTTIDYDGVAEGLKGVHWYFESTLLDSLSPRGLMMKAYESGRSALLDSHTEKGVSVAEIEKATQSLYAKIPPKSAVAATLIAMANESYREIDSVNRLNARYGVATLKEAIAMPACASLGVVKRLRAESEKAGSKEKRQALLRVRVLGQPQYGRDGACWRGAETLVNEKGLPSAKGRPVADWEEPFIVSRLALSSAVLADMWVKGWIEAGHPFLCETRQHPLKPAFISPTDPKCLGYALNENPAEFKMKSGRSALPWKSGAKHTGDCAHFD